jgi:hypothetical protein
VQPGSAPPTNAISSGATTGELKDIQVVPQAVTASMDERNTPGALVEISSDKGPAGTFLVSSLTPMLQELTLDGKRYDVSLRFRRYYYPFALTCLKTTYEKYQGTAIPKNYASRVRVQNPDRNEARETVIYMNNPLRYGGLTFYQYQMLAGEVAEQAGVRPSTTLQVVHNPSWLTPYLSCILVALGLLVQFGTHLFEFVKRRTA